MVIHFHKDDLNMPVLVIPRSGGLKEYFTVGDRELYIGRSETCDIFINDGSVSRRHAKLAPHSGGLVVEDLGSKNGTLINGELITRNTVKTGDNILFGDVASRLTDEIAAEASDERSMREQSISLRADALGPDANYLGFLFDLAPATPTFKDEKSVCKFAISALMEQLECDNVFVALYDNAAGRYNGGFFRGADPKAMAPVLPPGILHKTTHYKKAFLLTDVRQEFEGGGGRGFFAALCVPMLTGGELQGIIYLDRDAPKAPLNERDAAIGSAMAATFSSLIFMSRRIGHLRTANKTLKRKMEGLEMVGQSRAMTEVREKLVSIAAKTESPALILGEAGTGRALAARMIHRFSRRSDKPFLILDCPTIAPELMDSELFGHVRGAFPGADRDRRGLLELVDGGTLLIKSLEILPMDLQQKLFWFMETGEFAPLGAGKNISAKVRVIASMAGAPSDDIQSGRLREDLFFKMHALHVEIPPLRDRAEDIALLARHFLQIGRGRVSTAIKDFSHAAMDKLKNYDWPGNVRQLQKVVDASLFACDGEMILPEHILGIDDGDDDFDYEDFTDLDALQTLQTVQLGHGPLQAALDSVEKKSIQKALKRHKGNLEKTASELDISVSELKSKIEKFKIDLSF